MKFNSYSYRGMVNTVIGPILNYFGFHINNDGIIQQIGGDIGITLSGKHLYVPKNGEDYFKTKDSTLLIPFNPFKIREHMLILSRFLCSTLSDHFRDEDDVPEYNNSGDLIDIITLIKRGPKNEDNLPANFNGVIYETWLRQGEEVLGRGIDFEGNDIKAILMCMLDVLSKYSKLVPKVINYDRLFRYIQKVEKQKDLEIEEIRSKYSTTLNSVDFTSGDVMDNIITEPEIAEEEEEDEEDKKDYEVHKRTRFHNYDQYDDNAYEDLDLY